MPLSSAHFRARAILCSNNKSESHLCMRQEGKINDPAECETWLLILWEKYTVRVF